MSRKKIGIVGHINTESNTFGIGMAYLSFFTEKFNADVEIISHSELEVRGHLDLLVVPGGPDVDYKRYLDLDKGDQLSLFTGRPCNIRERFDEVLLPKYIEAGIPLVGICRGHQSIAVHFGAKLIQHIPRYMHETNGKDRKDLVHKVTYSIEALIKAGLPTPNGIHRRQSVFSDEVNSIHHQAVENAPKNAIVLSTYAGKLKGDAVIESMYYPEEKIYTTQWHPEEIADTMSVKIINKLLKING